MSGKRDKPNDSDVRLLKIAEKVADWTETRSGDTQSTENESGAIARNLASIARLAGAWRKFHQPSDQDGDATGQALFIWGHLNAIKKIGSGSFGEVYKAYDSVLDRTVALKLHRAESTSAIFSRAFIDEARRLAKVRHANVLAVHGAAIHDKRVGMWADLIAGENLANHQQNYDTKAITEIARSIAEALCAVHGAGIIHGDVKPANIMIDANGHITLMDFGAGSEKLEETGFRSSTSGTPMLMAPELFENGSPSQACDIYSLGVSLFKLLTGKYRFSSTNLVEMRAAHQREEYLSISRLRPDLPKQLIILLNSMLEQQPGKRPSALAIVQRIEWIENTPKRRRKRRAILSIIAGLSLATLFTSVGFYQATEARKEALQEKQNAEAVNSFLQDMLASASLQGSGRDTLVLDILNYAETELKSKFPERPAIRASLYYSLGLAFTALRQSRRAVDQYQRSADLFRSPAVDSIEGALNSEVRLGKLDEKGQSEPLCRSAKTAATPEMESYDDILARANVCIATALVRKGKHQEAITLLEASLTKSEKLDGTKTNAHLLGLHKLASAYRFSSQYEKAEKTARRAITWMHEFRPRAKANLLASQASLAMSLAKQERFEESTSLLRKVAEGMDSLYGRESRAAIGAWAALGEMFADSGQPETALEILTDAEATATKALGEDHYRTIITRYHLVNVETALGEIQAAKELAQIALRSAQKTLGETALPTLFLERSLANTLIKSGAFESALVLARANHQKFLEKVGENHEYALLSLDNVAQALAGLGQFEASLAIHREILAGMTKNDAEESSNGMMVLEHYGDTLTLSGNRDQASRTYRQLVDISRTTNDPEHSRLRRVSEKLKTLETGDLG